jgi:uncharacterized protein (DUF433 family)
MTTEQRTALHGSISSDPEIMHGTACFTGTRIPVQTLIDFLETGQGVNDFLSVYPYVSRDQVFAFLDVSTGLAVEQLSCTP